MGLILGQVGHVRLMGQLGVDMDSMDGWTFTDIYGQARMKINIHFGEWRSFFLRKNGIVVDKMMI